MTRYRIIFVGLFYLICSFSQAQVLKSEKAFLPVNNIPVEVVDEKVVAPPVIKIISPSIPDGGEHETTHDEINFIGKVSAEGGLGSLIVNSQVMEYSIAGGFGCKIFLEPGENKVKFVAMDKEDNISEYSMIINYIPPQLSISEEVERESKYYALIIGIQNYQDHSISNLDNPIRDARKLHNVLISRYTFEKENTFLLEDASREDIIIALDELAKKVTPNDNLLIFYAGHGWYDEGANIGYWLPSDARKGSKAAWFSNSRLVDYLKEVDSKHTLLIADACFTGSIFKTRGVGFSDTNNALHKLYELPSRKAMTSGTLTEVPDRSSFMKYLCEKLSYNRSKYLSSEQLFSSIRIAVINNSDAIPQYGEIRNVGDQGGDFIFIRK